MEIFIRGLIALGIALAVATVGFSGNPAVSSSTPANVGGCNGCGTGGKSLHGQGRLAHLFDGKGNKAPAQPADPHHKAPRTQPGTVVFPQHPFARGPRDFFMVD